MANEEAAYVPVTPILVEVSADLEPSADQLVTLMSDLRESLFLEIGVRFPHIIVRPSAMLHDAHYRFLINEVPVTTAMAQPGRYLVNETVEKLRVREIDCIHAINPVTSHKSAWVAEEDSESLENLGLQIRSAAEVVTEHLGAVLLQNARVFVSIQSVQNMLDGLAAESPASVAAIVPGVVSLLQLTEVLGRLVEEEVSIRNLPTILQSIGEFWRPGIDSMKLTEAVRCAMRHYLTHKFSHQGRTLLLYLLDPAIEESIRGSIRSGPEGSYLALEPEVAQNIVQAVRDEFTHRPPHAARPLILTAMDVRRYIRKLLEFEFHPALRVLSYQELAPDANLEPIARISLRP